jgi:hypothetical protein
VLRARRPWLRFRPWTSRPLAACSAAIFAAQFVVLDLCVRAGAYARSPRLWLSAAGSIAVGALLHRLATRWPVRVVVAFATAAILVVQTVCFAYYRAPIDVQVLASALHAWTDVRRAVVPNLPRAIAIVAGVGLAELALLSARRESAARPKLVLALAVLSLVGLSLGVPLADASPEVRLLDSTRALWRPREPPIAGAIALPELPSTRSVVPNVLFVVTESVRASDYCSGREPSCDVAPETHALLRDRITLSQMRAVSSYTAIAIGAILTGRSQDGPRAELARMPYVFDWTRAVRTPGGRPRAIYWSAQSESIFERADPRGMADDVVTLETLTGKTYVEDPVDTGFDRLLYAHVERELPKLRGSYLLMLHFFSTHAPYFVEPSDAPFRPWSQVVSWSGMPALYNAYKNSIHEQDKLVARSVRAFIDAQRGQPWLVLFTSDHGEAFGEHGAIHHGQNLHDEQIHVPAWIAYSPGALSPAQEANLRAWRDAYVTHLDLLPTLLDVFGVLDSLPMAALRSELDGRSLLRPYVPMRKALPITNCTQMFPCPVNAWGVLRDRWELHAQVWDPEWQCVDLGGADRADGAECARLREASRAYFPTLPNKKPNH